MEEKYYSIKHIGVKYKITDKRIDRIQNNFTMGFRFTEEYYGYIKSTCIMYYPHREILFLGYFKRLYNAFVLKEEIYACNAWNMGIEED